MPNEGEGKGQVGIATRQTRTSLKAGEKISEALEIWDEETRALTEYELVGGLEI